MTPPYIGPSRDTRGGFLIAFDPATRSERWRVQGGGGSGGGVVVTASNLVFQTVNDGRLRVLDASSGGVALGGAGGQRGLGPPITYQVDGQQQISLLAGVNSNGGLTPMAYTFALLVPMPAP